MSSHGFYDGRASAGSGRRKLRNSKLTCGRGSPGERLTTLGVLVPSRTGGPPLLQWHLEISALKTAVSGGGQLPSRHVPFSPGLARR